MYKLLLDSDIIHRLADNAFIPPSTANQDYLVYLEWLAQGNQPEPADVPVIDYNALRMADYQAESDPLFFKAQRGEATMEQWLAKIEEIKSRYPA